MSGPVAPELDADDANADDVVAPARGGPRAARYAAIAVGLVLVVFIALLATRQPVADQSTSNAIVGGAMPKVTGTTLDGQTIDLDTLRGKWVVVNFFATWCTGCRIEHPELVKFQQQHQAAGDVQVVSIAFNDQAAALKTFFQKEGGDWPVIVSDDGRAAIDFGVTGIPESFVIAPNQLVVAHFEGVSADALNAVIDRFDSSAGSGTTSTVAPAAAASGGGAPGGVAP